MKDEEGDFKEEMNQEYKGERNDSNDEENDEEKNLEGDEENEEEPEQIILEPLESGYGPPGSSSYGVSYDEDGNEGGEEEGEGEGDDNETLFFEAAQETNRSDVEGTC